MITPLIGHDSVDTAWIDADYPFGFRLRCQRRVWLEWKKGHGFRMVTQTSNPKIASRRVVCQECGGGGHFVLEIPRKQYPCKACNGVGYHDVLTWNKPKAGIYHALAALYLDDNGHVQIAGLHVYCGLDKFDQFVATYGACFGDWQKRIATQLRVIEQRQAGVKYTTVVMQG